MNYGLISAFLIARIIRPRSEHGIDWGTPRLVLGRHGERELWWQGGHKGWVDRMTPSGYFESQLSVATSARSPQTTVLFRGGRLASYRIKEHAARIFELLGLPGDVDSLRAVESITQLKTACFSVNAKPETPCERCDEPTLNDRFCRDCDIEYCFAMNMCVRCEAIIMSAELYGPIHAQHAVWCPLRTAAKWTAESEAEQWARWDARTLPAMKGPSS